MARHKLQYHIPYTSYDSKIYANSVLFHKSSLKNASFLRLVFGAFHPHADNILYCVILTDVQNLDWKLFIFTVNDV